MFGLPPRKPVHPHGHPRARFPPGAEEPRGAAPTSSATRCTAGNCSARAPGWWPSWCSPGAALAGGAASRGLVGGDHRRDRQPFRAGRERLRQRARHAPRAGERLIWRAMLASGVLTCALGFAASLPWYVLAALIMLHMIFVMGDSSALTAGVVTRADRAHPRRDDGGALDARLRRRLRRAAGVRRGARFRRRQLEPARLGLRLRRLSERARSPWRCSSARGAGPRMNAGRGNFWRRVVRRAVIDPRHHKIKRTMGKKTQVIVAGAGPVGLLTALALAKQDVSVLVLEAEPGSPRPARRAPTIRRRSELMAPYGITDEMHKTAIKVPHWQIRDRKRRRHRRMGRERDRGPHALSLSPAPGAAPAHAHHPREAQGVPPRRGALLAQGERRSRRRRTR